MAEQLLSIVEYARAFQLSDMTVRRRIKTGRLQAFLQDGKYYIPVPSGEARGQGESPQVAQQHDAYFAESMHQQHHMQQPAPQPQAPRRPQQEMQVIKG